MTRTSATSRKAALDAIFKHLAAQPAEANALAAMRSHAETYGMGEKGHGVEECQATTTTVGGRPALWFTPPKARDDLRLVHLHGGGWIAGSMESHRALAAELAWLSNAAVLLPSYRLAPEHPYPAALDDAMVALDHARLHSPQGPAPSAAIGVSGDSAGGNLAAALALKCAATGRRGPDRTALMSPFLALTLGPGVFRAPTHDPVVQQDGIDFVAAMYRGGQSDADQFVEPLLGDGQLLALLGPVLIQASAAESLRHQALAFADRLWEVGVEARLSLWANLPHVWHVFLETLPDARLAVTEVAAFMTRA
jgi:epsilon-lactone hydrolase